MKKGSNRAILGLLMAIAAGFIAGLIVWLAGIEGGGIAPFGFALGFGLFYLHRRWLKNVNKSKHGPKLKGFI